MAQIPVSLLKAQVSVADGTAGAPSISFSNDTNTGIYRAGTDALGVVTAGVERMRVGSDGNVGIGVTNPQTRLHVDGYITSSTPYYSARINAYASGSTGVIVYGVSPVTNVSSWYNTTNGRFTPQVPGIYYCFFTVNTETSCYIIWQKNTTEIARGLAQLAPGTGWGTAVCTTLVSLNGTTDYVVPSTASGGFGSLGTTTGNLVIYRLT